MPDNKELKPNTPAPAGTPAAGNGSRHSHHGHRGHGNRGPRPEGQAQQEKSAQSAPSAPNAAEARPPRENRNNRPHNDRNGGKPQNAQNGGKPQNGQNGKPQNGKSPKSDRQSGAPEKQGAPKQNAPKNAQPANGTRENDRQRGRQDRNNRRKDRRKEPQNAETSLPESLITESFLTSKDDGFFSRPKEEDYNLDDMPPDPTLDAVFADPTPAEEPAEGTEIVGIHFPQGGKVYYFDPIGISFAQGDNAIVETARGLELGEVALANRKVPESSIVQPLKPVIRLATKEDIEHAAKNAAKEADALAICKKKVTDHKLDMKLTGAQYTFDNAKLIFYFTAAQRVDFRELVKDLATTFHTRIELRQIGSRDEAKMVGGFGLCGRHLCCASFLPNYCQSTMKMAKRQGLGMNNGKNFGVCGRLMCCLKFEESTYERELALMPTVGSMVETQDGRGVVTDVRPVGYFVKVKLEEKPDAAPKMFKLADIRVLQRADETKDEEPDTPEEDN